MNFVTPNPADYHVYKPLLECSELTCENCFLNAVMWGNSYKYEYVLLNGGKTLVARIHEGGDIVYFLPLGELFYETVDAVVRENGGSAVFCVSDGERLDRLLEKYSGLSPIPYEENFEYIYNSVDLALLAGKKYHQKRNHISAFSRKYSWHFEELCDRNAADILSVTAQWAAEREVCDESLSSELEAITRVVSKIEELEILGGLLYADGVPIAYTFGQQISPSVFDVNVEKALSEYNGAYAVINREFAAQVLYPKYKYINREDDLGIEGLRKAKLSYHPSVILKKYLVTVKA